MPEGGGSRLEGIDRKLDRLIGDLATYRERVERRLTALETTRREGVRLSTLWLGLGGGAVMSVIAAWISKHI